MAAPSQTNERRVQRTAVEPTVIDGQRIMVGDLVLNLAERKIYTATARPITLSENEFRILATLIKDAGRFVSVPTLTAAAVGDQEVHKSVVATYVQYLRREIQRARSAVTIERDPELGYRLCP